MDHVYVKFGFPSCIGFRDTMWKNRQVNSGENSNPVTAVGVGNWKSLARGRIDHFSTQNSTTDQK